MVSKTQAAFILSTRKLCAQGDPVYFWTFTFVKVWPDWYYPRSWEVFIHRIQNHYGGFLQGLRVIEVSPGGHGLHYHALLNKRVSIHVMRRQWWRVAGWGARIQVDKKPAGEFMGEYLSKYLSKSGPKLWEGMRKWGTIGGFRQCKVKDIVIDSSFHRNVFALARGKRLPIQDIGWIYAQSMYWGDFHEWPSDIRQQCFNRAWVEPGFGKDLTDRGNHDTVLRYERKTEAGFTGNAALPSSNNPF